LTSISTLTLEFPNLEAGFTSTDPAQAHIKIAMTMNRAHGRQRLLIDGVPPFFRGYHSILNRTQHLA
jgi:hypothetical protein